MALGRRALAEKLLELERKVAPDLLKIDGYKDQLRALCEEDGESFTEEVEGLGTVEVKAGTEKKFKGRVPELQAEKFLELTEGRQNKLIEDGLVAWENEYTRGSKPSVTVRL